LVIALLRLTDAETRLNKLEARLVGRLGLAKEDMRFIAALLSLPYQERYGTILVSTQARQRRDDAGAD